MRDNILQSFVICFFIVLFISLPVCFAAELHLVYDGNGNLISGDGKYREYNEFNQLIRVSDSITGQVIEEYVYHPTEDRILIKKLNDDRFNDTDQTIVYVNDNFVRHYDIDDSPRIINDTYYIRDENEVLAEIIFNGTSNTPIFTQGRKIFYHNDPLGSNRVTTNQSGVVIENTSYAPYGEILFGGQVGRFNYEGKEFSADTRDYDFNYRKYNSELGLFTQPDPIIQNVYDPQSLNRYAFERNNPYKYVDPSGKIFWAIPVVYALYYLGTTAPVWTPALYQLSLYQFSEDLDKFSANPSPGNLFWAAFSGYDALTPGIPEKTAAKKGVETFEYLNKLKQYEKTLKETQEVTVDSFSEANDLRKMLFPEAKKIPGAGPSMTKASESLFKGKNIYKTDYLIDRSSGNIYGHMKESSHLQIPHINIKDELGIKYTIKIGGLFQ